MLHVYHGNNVGHRLYPRTAGQTLTNIMTIRSTSLEPKSQLTINLDPGWECQSLPSKKKTQREGKFPIQEREKTQKENKIPKPRKGEDTKKKENSQWKSGRKQNFSIKDRKKTKETSRKVFGGEGRGNFRISESKKIWVVKSKMGDIDSITLKIGGRILQQTSLFYFLFIINYW